LAVLILALLPAATSPHSIAAPLPSEAPTAVPGRTEPKPAPAGKQPALADASEEVAAADGSLVSISSAGGPLAFCSSYGGPNWISRNSRNYQTVRGCSLSVPTDSVAYINATATGVLPRDQGSWVGSFQLAVGATPDSLQGDARTERTLFLRNNRDLPNDPDSLGAKTLATSLLQPLAAGTHSFGLLGIANFGEVRLTNPAISVVFIPRTTLDVASCGQGSNTWTATPAANFQSIVSCPLTVPRDGYALVSATSAVGAADQAYEARFRIGTDTVGAPQSDRYVNVYPAPFSVSSETVASSALLPVRAGSNTFHFLGYRYAGSGTMNVRNPYLSVIYFPSSSLSAFSCAAAGANLVSVDQTTFTPVVSCQLAVPRDTLAFIDSSMSVSIGTSPSGPAQEYEGRSRIGVDSTEGAAETERRFSTEADEGDGSDLSVAGAVVVPLARGAHTFSVNVRRSRGNQPVRMYTPTLNVLVPGPRGVKLLPLITIQATATATNKRIGHE